MSSRRVELTIEVSAVAAANLMVWRNGNRTGLLEVDERSAEGGAAHTSPDAKRGATSVELAGWPFEPVARASSGASRKCLCMSL
jgi:hypothetical protein